MSCECLLSTCTMQSRGRIVTRQREEAAGLESGGTRQKRKEQQTFSLHHTDSTGDSLCQSTAEYTHQIGGQVGAYILGKRSCWKACGHTILHSLVKQTAECSTVCAPPMHLSCICGGCVSSVSYTRMTWETHLALDITPGVPHDKNRTTESLLACDMRYERGEPHRVEDATVAYHVSTTCL